MNKRFFITASVAIGIVAIMALTWFLNPERKMREEINATIEQQKVDTTEALYFLINVANELSGIKSAATFNFELVSLSGRAANFGIVRYDGARGERIIKEQMAIFRELNGSSSDGAEVDVETNRVVAMHRAPVDFGREKPADELEKIAKQFLEKVEPDFATPERFIQYNPASKTIGQKGGNYFFRWQNNQFALPDGLEMDFPPFVQVGITSDGFIFNYNNTHFLYENLPKSALRKICAFAEKPITSDDSYADPEKEIFVFYFTDERGQNKYLRLPFEPKNDFEGCSDQMKEIFRSFWKSIKEQRQSVAPAEEVDGTIMAIDKEHISIQDKDGNTIDLLLTAKTRFYNENNKEINAASFQKGIWITVRGERTASSTLIPVRVKKWYSPGDQPSNSNY